MDDKEIVTRIQAGETELFDQLVVSYNKQVHQVCLGYLKNEQDAEEATQDTFIRAWKSINNFRNDSKFYTWLFRIASNVSKRYLENRKRDIVDTVEVIDEVESTDTPETQLRSKELDSIAMNAIDNLSDIHRDVFKLKYETEMTYDEMSKQLNIPVGTVRSRLNRARHLIETAIEE